MCTYCKQSRCRVPNLTQAPAPGLTQEHELDPAAQILKQHKCIGKALQPRQPCSLQPWGFISSSSMLLTDHPRHLCNLLTAPGSMLHLCVLQTSTSTWANSLAQTVKSSCSLAAWGKEYELWSPPPKYSSVHSLPLRVRTSFMFYPLTLFYLLTCYYLIAKR